MSILLIAEHNNKEVRHALGNIYEDLSKRDSDRYEYVPNFSFSKAINNNYSFRSRGYYKNYNTNITEKVIINDLEFNSDQKYLDNGILINLAWHISDEINNYLRQKMKFKGKIIDIISNRDFK